MILAIFVKMSFESYFLGQGCEVSRILDIKISNVWNPTVEVWVYVKIFLLRWCLHGVCYKFTGDKWIPAQMASNAKKFPLDDVIMSEGVFPRAPSLFEGVKVYHGSSSWQMNTLKTKHNLQGHFDLCNWSFLPVLCREFLNWMIAQFGRNKDKSSISLTKGVLG